MRTFRERLTYANVVSTLALFLALCGGIAYAARVPRRSVGPSQLKANAVTTAKIKANAVTTRKIKRNAVTNAKIRDNAIESEKIANGSVGEAEIDMSGVPFGRVVLRARGNTALTLTEAPKLYPLVPAAYTQGANEVDQFAGAVDVTFPGSCAPPRSASASLLIDSANPFSPKPEEFVAAGEVSDSGAGVVNRRIELGPTGGVVATRFEPGVPTGHSLSLMVEGKCGTGSGIVAGAAGADVIGTR